MKKLIFALVSMIYSTMAFAQDYKYLTVVTTSSESSIELATVKKITFDMTNRLVVVTTSEGQTTFPQSEMQKMFFADAPTAIDTLPESSDDLYVSGGVLCVKGEGLVRIYNASGALLHMAHVEGSARISLSNIPSGIYIANIGKHSIKFSK